MTYAYVVYVCQYYTKPHNNDGLERLQSRQLIRQNQAFLKQSIERNNTFLHMKF